MRHAIRFSTLALLLVLISRTVRAQELPVDRLTPPLPTAAERKAADIASWGTVLTAIALDAKATWDKSCRSSWDECQPALVKTSLRYGVTIGAAQAIKMLVARQRPCASTSSCGIDSPDSSFYSMHTALAFQALGGPRLAVSLPLAIGTGGLRIAAGKHWLTDVLAGAAAGSVASLIR